MTAMEVQAWLVERLATVLSVPEAEVTPDMSLDVLGLDSVSKMGLAGELEVWSRRRVEPEDIYAARSLTDLAAAVAERWARSERPALTSR